jgi:prevent-host-death family protein
MKEISQRELRNDNAEIMRGVEAGETYVVTRRGVPVARIVPISEPELRIDRPAKKRYRFAERTLVESSVSIAEILDDLRGDR